MKYLLISTAFLCCALWCCDKDDVSNTCYSFDIRQCQTDNFADAVPESDPLEQRELKMKQWLVVEGIDVEDIKLELNFHDAVCEACDICPQGDRYYILVQDKYDNDNPLISSLRLLNYEQTSCDDIF